MNDSRFIELLNLYVDHQISAEDAAVLETEIQRSPDRRRIYRQYCQMQKACVLLAENFRTDAPSGGRIVAFAAQHRRFAQFAYAIGGIAAAACIALVVVTRDATPASTGDEASVVSVEPAAALQPTVTQAPTAPIPLPARVALQPVFAGFESDTTPSTSLMVTGVNQVPLDWMDRVQLRKVTTDELWFEPRASSQPQDLLFRSPRRFHGPTEMTAWRFQK